MKRAALISSVDEEVKEMNEKVIPFTHLRSKSLHLEINHQIFIFIEENIFLIQW